MIKRLNKISIKYAIAFVGVALSLLAVVVVDMLLVHSVENRMSEFSGPFHTATSAVLNADRDLYQARVAAMKYTSLTPGSDAAKAALASYKENAQQAYDRMHKFERTLAGYPDVVASVKGYEALYKKWQLESGKIFSLYDSGNTEAARAQLGGAAQTAFSNLRTVYNTAEEAMSAKVKALEAETHAQVKYEEYTVASFSLIVALIAIIIALAGPLMMSRAIRRITERIKEITDGDGDLTARIVPRRSDEIGDLARNFNAFISRIDNTLQTVRESTEGVSLASNEIAQGSRELSARTEQSAANLEQTSASMEEITATVKNTAEAADQGSTIANSSVTVARRGEETMTQLEKTMEEISSSAAQIAEITSLIDGIAFQTNLLALNASVEAARAGENGRGFAVVAKEVRTLASRASDASHDIRQLVETSVARTRAGSELVRTTGSTMQEIVQGVERVTEVIGEIRTGAREQSDGINEINTAVSELDGATQRNAALVEQTSAAAEQMRDQARQLSSLIATFKLSDTASQRSQSGQVAVRAPKTASEKTTFKTDYVPEATPSAA